ncbi:hypothetical protein GCM10009628_13980 [Paeniglutamicibacter kerguelensis]
MPGIKRHALVAVTALFLRDANLPAVVAVGVVFSLASSFGTYMVAAKFLRHKAAKEASEAALDQSEGNDCGIDLRKFHAIGIGPVYGIRGTRPIA